MNKKNKEFTIDEVFAEINKMSKEEKEILSKNTNLYNVVQIMNEPEQYKKTIKAINDSMKSWSDTKIALMKLKVNMNTRYCRQLEERAKAFVAPEDAFIMPDVRANNFARMVNVLANVTQRPVGDCSRIVYDILTRLSCLKSYQSKHDSTDEDIITSANALKQLGIDVAKTPFNLFTELHSKRETFSSLSISAISRCIAGLRYAEYGSVLIDSWEDTFKPISTQKVVESVYSLKETTEAMDRYFAEM